MNDAEARSGARCLEPSESQANCSQAGSFQGLGWARYVQLHLNGATAVPLIDLMPAEAAARLARMLEEHDEANGLVTVAFMNMRNYVAARRTAATTFSDIDQVYPDGVGLQIARHLLGLPRFARVSGTDTVPLLLAAMRPGMRVFMLGGSPAVCAAAQARFPRLFPEAILAGAHHGLVSEAEDAALTAAIAQSRADVILIGMGSPSQEHWLARNRNRLSARLAICVGGLFHYWAEDLRRAPRAMRVAGLEWLWILVQQPYKWRVYSIDAAYFGAALMQMRLKRLLLP